MRRYRVTTMDLATGFLDTTLFWCRKDALAAMRQWRQTGMLAHITTVQR